MISKKQGRLIGFIGLPGCGKSTLTSILAEKITAKEFREPEEGEWAECVHRRSEVGNFSGLQWFRSIRVPMLYEARRLADNGEIVFIDSLYDKLCVSYLGEPGMEWLIEPGDKYFEVAKMIAELDKDHLPDVDAIVTITVDKGDYVNFLQNRGRSLDSNENLAENWATQKYFIKAANQYSSEKKIQHIEFKNRIGTVQQAADQLYNQLKSKRVLS